MKLDPEEPGTSIPCYVPAPGDTEHAAIQRDYLQFLTDVAEQCGDVAAYRRRGSPVVQVNSPELVRGLLIDGGDDFTKGRLQRSAFGTLLGESVSVSEGKRHHELRRLLAPLFTRRRVARYAERIANTADRLCATWPEEGQIDLPAELDRLTLHTLGWSLIAEHSFWEETGEFWRARHRIWLWINRFAAQRRHLASPVDAAPEGDVGAAITVIQEAVDRVVAQRLRGGSGPDDMLSDILDANRGAGHLLSRTEIRDQVLALLFAAHETSAVALFWSLYLVTRHPGSLERLEHEADTVLRGRPPTLGGLRVLPHALRVVKEAMRLYPPAGRQFRITVRDTQLGSHAVPEGTPVTMCQYILHRRPASFPEPDRFRPQRFFDDRRAWDPLAYLPFGAGERICLGRHYAMLETHLLLALLVDRFRFAFPEGVYPELAVTLRPCEGGAIQIRRRHQRNRASSISRGV